MTIIALLYSLLRLVLFHTDIFSEETLNWFSNIEFMIISAIPAIVIIWVAIIFDKGTVNRKILLLIGVGFALFWFGEVLWFYYELILKEDPFPSIADFFYLLAYIPLMMGLFIKARSITIPAEKVRIGISSLILLLYAVLTSIYVIIPISEDPGDLFEAIVSFSYPVLDVFLVAATSYLFAKYAGGRMEKAWIVMTLSMYIMSIADSLFAYQEWEEIYDSSSWADDFFVWSYLIAAIFGFYLRDTFKS